MFYATYAWAITVWTILCNVLNGIALQGRMHITCDIWHPDGIATADITPSMPRFGPQSVPAAIVRRARLSSIHGLHASALQLLVKVCYWTEY